MEPHLTAALLSTESPGTTATLVALCAFSLACMVYFFVVAVRKDLAEHPAGLRQEATEPTEEQIAALHEDPWPLTGQLTEIGRDR